MGGGGGGGGGERTFWEGEGGTGQKEGIKESGGEEPQELNPLRDKNVKHPPQPPSPSFFPPPLRPPGPPGPLHVPAPDSHLLLFNLTLVISPPTSPLSPHSTNNIRLWQFFRVI